MAGDATVHLVVNTGPAAPERITGFAQGDTLGLVGFFGAELAFDGAATVRQSLVVGPDGGASLQLDVYEAGGAAPAATVLLVGVAHALDAHEVLRW